MKQVTASPGTRAVSTLPWLRNN